MRAVNLVPADSRQGRVNGGKSGGAAYAVLGVMAILLVALSVFAINKRHEAEATQELATVTQSTQAYAAAASEFSSFEAASTEATQRISTVRGLADARFDWAGALRDMARLIPADTQISGLSASVSPTSGAGGGGAANALRGSINSPAISLSGCSKSQSTVANLINQLQAMRRVTNVTLTSSEQKEDSSGGEGGTCSIAGSPFEFSLVVFMVPGKAVAAGEVVPSTTPAATAASSVSGTTPAATTPASGASQ